MRLLVANGADVTATNVRGSDALMMIAGIEMYFPDEDSGTNEDAEKALHLALELGAGDPRRARRQTGCQERCRLDARGRVQCEPKRPGDADGKTPADAHGQPWTYDAHARGGPGATVGETRVRDSIAGRGARPAPAPDADSPSKPGQTATPPK